MGQLTCKAVLFDLDGVLVDSTPCVMRVWRGWALEHGREPEAVIHTAHGRRAIETLRLVAPEMDAEAELREVERRELEDMDGLVVFPGARELLASLPPERWTVVTSGTRALATKRMTVAGLPVPPRMVTADDVTLGKPDPAPFLKAAALLGLPPEDCVVIEDAPSGIRAALAAGMKCIAVPTTYTHAEIAEADVVLDAIAQLTASVEGGVIRLTW